MLSENNEQTTELTDTALIGQFVANRDAAAFESLVRRHGPMVLGVCRRVLRNGHDADDAFQAAFLVFFRKAHSIRATGKVANWLYGVAFRSALKVKSTRAVMRSRETPFENVHAQATRESSSDLEELLDRELAALPEKYRLPIVLCDLEGCSLKEAARLLACPEGTVSGTLSRGRTLLRNRLTRRGLALSIAALLTALSRQASAAGVPAPLLNSTIHGARLLASGKAGLAEAYSVKVAALTKGVMKSMLLAKLRFTGAALVAIVGAGAITATLSSNRSVAQNQNLIADASQQQPGDAPDASARERAAKEQAEKAASGHDPAPGNNQPGNQADKIAAENAAKEKTAKEKAAAEQRAAAAQQSPSQNER